MYIIKDTNRGGFIGVDNELIPIVKEKILTIPTSVLRFTEYEMLRNELPEGQEWVWYGSYLPLKEIKDAPLNGRTKVRRK